MTFSNNKYYGFKSQLCYPYHPIDPSLRRRLNILEIPTAFMDWTALNRGCKLEGCKEILTRIFDAVERYHGCFATNFHNTYLNKSAFPEVYQMYLWLLEQTVSRGYWIRTGFECRNWWTIRSETKITLNFEKGTIVGYSPVDIPIIIDRPDGQVTFKTVSGAFNIHGTKEI